MEWTKQRGCIHYPGDYKSQLMILCKHSQASAEPVQRGAGVIFTRISKTRRENTLSLNSKPLYKEPKTVTVLRSVLHQTHRSNPHLRRLQT